MSRTLRRKRKTSQTIRDGQHQYHSTACQHNGSCEHCRRNRLYSSRHRAPADE
jgi:hypothetical protein